MFRKCWDKPKNYELDVLSLEEDSEVLPNNGLILGSKKQSKDKLCGSRLYKIIVMVLLITQMLTMITVGYFGSVFWKEINPMIAPIKRIVDKTNESLPTILNIINQTDHNLPVVIRIVNETDSTISFEYLGRIINETTLSLPQIIEIINTTDIYLPNETYPAQAREIEISPVPERLKNSQSPNDSHSPTSFSLDQPACLAMRVVAVAAAENRAITCERLGYPYWAWLWHHRRVRMVYLNEMRHLRSIGEHRQFLAR